MKLVAAAKMRKAQEKMEEARPYSERLSNIIISLLPDVDRALLPLLDKREIKREALVIVTGDRGMAGAFNGSIIKRAEQEISEIGKENIDLVCIGKKGRDHFKSRGYEILVQYTDFWGDLGFNHAMSFGEEIVNYFLHKSVDRVRVVYNWFKNIAVQEVRTEDLLPLTYSDEVSKAIHRLYEPSKSDIVSSLIPRHLNVQVWKYLLESYASEQAARMVAMDNATENAQELIKDLTLDFNKARQAAITKEMLEIVGGAEALSSN